MPDGRYREDYDRAAAGLDFDEPLRERASSLGQAVAAEGPQVLLDEIEELLPEAWREQISTFPLTAVLAGIVIGVFLGKKKGEEILAAGSSLITAAATANLTKVLARNDE